MIGLDTIPHEYPRVLASLAKELFNQDKLESNPVVPYVQRYSLVHFLISSGHTGIGIPHLIPFDFAIFTNLENYCRNISFMNEIGLSLMVPDDNQGGTAPSPDLSASYNEEGVADTTAGEMTVAEKAREKSFSSGSGMGMAIRTDGSTVCGPRKNIMDFCSIM